MNRANRGRYDMVVGAIFCSALLLCSAASAHGQDGKRCYVVNEPFYKIHKLKLTPEIRPIKRCYSEKDHPYRYSILDIPVSLAEGTVRTPEFSPQKSVGHWILLQFERPLEAQQMRCMTATTQGPLDLKDCTDGDPLLHADWTVWEDGKPASSGSSTTEADAKFTSENIFKFLGKFPMKAGRKYVLEVKFTRDGTPLNIANPHLIVTKIGEE